MLDAATVNVVTVASTVLELGIKSLRSMINDFVVREKPRTVLSIHGI